MTYILRSLRFLLFQDYNATIFKQILKFDLLVDDCLLVELKAIQDVLPIHKTQLLSYMKLLDGFSTTGRLLKKAKAQPRFFVTFASFCSKPRPTTMHPRFTEPDSPSGVLLWRRY